MKDDLSGACDEHASDEEDNDDNETSARGERGDARGHDKSAAGDRGAVDACAGLDSWFEAALAPLFARPTNALLGGVYDRHTLALAGRTKEPELVRERERERAIFNFKRNLMLFLEKELRNQVAFYT